MKGVKITKKNPPKYFDAPCGNEKCNHEIRVPLTNINKTITVNCKYCGSQNIYDPKILKSFKKLNDSIGGDEKIEITI